MAQPSWIGRTLSDRYEILEPLGQGGMSAVYKANDRNLKRVVAVKIIHPHLSANEDFVRRFEAEAAAVAQLRHPNLIQVFDFSHDQDTYYIVFEFVPGETLQARLRRLNKADRRMSVDEAVAIAAKTADGLHYAHNKGLVHRDIKPSNIMLNVYGEPIVMDFGIAKMLGGTQHTATGAVLGTAKYMSPEQIKGERIDPRTDVYSLGVTLFEMLSGRPPFDADSAMTIMMMHMTDPVPDVREIRNDVPPALVAVVNRALAKDANARYASAAEFAAALRGATGDAAAATGATMVESTAPQAPDEDETAAEPVTTAPVRMTDADLMAPGFAGTSEAASDRDDTAPPIGGAPPGGPPRSGAGTAVSDGRPRPSLLAGGALLVLLVAALLVWFAFFRNAPSDAAGDAPVLTIAEQTATALAAAAVPEETDTPEPEPTTAAATATATRAATATATPTEEAAPTETPTTMPTETAEPPPAATATLAPTAEPTEPAGPEVSARINNISLENDRYVVNYETFGYTEQLPGQHVHFYWNNISQEQAGVGPNQASWYVYGGPRPFTGWGVADRPAGVSAMCVVAANPDHTAILDTGNCVPLPE